MITSELGKNPSWNPDELMNVVTDEMLEAEKLLVSSLFTPEEQRDYYELVVIHANRKMNDAIWDWEGMKRFEEYRDRIEQAKAASKTDQPAKEIAPPSQTLEVTIRGQVFRLKKQDKSALRGDDLHGYEEPTTPKVYAIKIEKDGKQYWVVAKQSKWLPDAQGVKKDFGFFLSVTEVQQSEDTSVTVTTLSKLRYNIATALGFMLIPNRFDIGDTFVAEKKVEKIDASQEPEMAFYGASVLEIYSAN